MQSGTAGDTLVGAAELVAAERVEECRKLIDTMIQTVPEQNDSADRSQWKRGLLKLASADDAQFDTTQFLRGFGSEVDDPDGIAFKKLLASHILTFNPKSGTVYVRAPWVRKAIAQACK